MQMGLPENRQSGKGEPVTRMSHRLPSFLSDILLCHSADYSIIGVTLKQIKNVIRNGLAGNTVNVVIGLLYVNTVKMADPVQELRDITGGKGYDDVFVCVPNRRKEFVSFL